MSQLIKTLHNSEDATSAGNPTIILVFHHQKTED